MNQKLMIGLIIEGIGALGAFLCPMLLIMTWNKYFLIAGVISFVMLIGGFLITLL